MNDRQCGATAQMTKTMNQNDYTPAPGEPEEFVQQRRNALPTPAKEPAEERLARTPCSATLAIIRRKEYPQNYFGHNDNGPMWNSSLAYAKRVPVGDVQAIIDAMAARGQHAWGEIHPQNKAIRPGANEMKAMNCPTCWNKWEAMTNGRCAHCGGSSRIAESGSDAPTCSALVDALSDILPQHALACVSGLDLHNGKPWSFDVTDEGRPLITRESCKCSGDSMRYLRGLLPDGHPKGFMQKAKGMARGLAAPDSATTTDIDG